jgi:hypothetical protein
MNVNSGTSNNHANNNETVTNNNSKNIKKLGANTRKARRNKGRFNTMRKRSFANSNTIRRWLGQSQHKNIRKLYSIHRSLDYLLRKYNDDDTDEEMRNKYSIFFTNFGEEMAKDIKDTFWHSKSDAFKAKTKKYISEAGLEDFDLDDFENYILETTYFLDWLVKLSAKNSDFKDDIESYAEHYVKKYTTIYKEAMEEVKKEVVQENPDDLDDIIKAFSKAKIV